MKAKLLFLTILIACTGSVKAQLPFDTTKYKIDTTAPPPDALTQKIRELRSERGGLNVQQVALMKIKEQQASDKSMPAAYYTRLLKEFETGRGSKLLENVAINLYRQGFTETEIDDLVRFYKTSAGKKMATDFILIMMQSAKFAEILVSQYSRDIRTDMISKGEIK